MPAPDPLSRRERQIMDILFAEGEASVNVIHNKLPDVLTHTAIRTFLRILSEKGHIRRRKQGREYLYRPRARREPAGKQAMRRVLNTFFEGSLEKAVAAHLADRQTKLSPDELKRIQQMITDAQSRQS